MWRDNDVRSHHEGVKHRRHPILGPLAFEYSAFAVDGWPDLCMVVYNPRRRRMRTRLARSSTRETEKQPAWLENPAPGAGRN
jgi:hypothetical protein